MGDANYEKDADRMIDFFSDLEGQYSQYGPDKGLISFCLHIFNIDQISDVGGLRDSYNDLRSIGFLISRSVDVEKQKEFKSIVMDGIDRVYMWLTSVYNHRVDKNDASLLFSNDAFSNHMMKSVSARVLRDDYFTFINTKHNLTNPSHVIAELDTDLAMSSGTDTLTIEDKNVVFGANRIPWTDREIIWTGNKQQLESRLNAKYRKAKDKRLIAIMKSSYITYGDNFLFKKIQIEEGALDKPNGFTVDKGEDGSGILLVVKKEVSK